MWADCCSKFDTSLLRSMVQIMMFSKYVLRIGKTSITTDISIRVKVKYSQKKKKTELSKRFN